MFGNGMHSSTAYGSTAFCTVFINPNIANDKNCALQDNKQYCTSIKSFVIFHKNADITSTQILSINIQQDSDF